MIIHQTMNNMAVRGSKMRSKAEKSRGEVTTAAMFSFLLPLPYFPSDLHGHLAALAGTTRKFPLARLVVRQRVYLFVCLPHCACSQHLPAPPPCLSPCPSGFHLLVQLGKPSHCTDTHTDDKRNESAFEKKVCSHLGCSELQLLLFCFIIKKPSLFRFIFSIIITTGYLLRYNVVPYSY